MAAIEEKENMGNKTIGPKIKDFRKRNNLTQDALAQSLGYYGKSVISHIEKGDADMTYEKIALLLKKYDLDANELFDLDRKGSTKKATPKAEAPKQEEVVPDGLKRVVVYIHGLNGSAKEAKDYGFLKEKYDVVGLDLENDIVTVYNPYGYIENVTTKEFISRTTFDAYKNMPLFLNFGFAFGAFHKNTIFYAK